MEKLSRRIALPAALGLLLAAASCRSAPEPVPAPEPAPVAEPEPPVEPEPLDIDWAGTVWISEDPDLAPPRTFPGYAGFCLARDGNVLFLGAAGVAGGSWSVEGNRMELESLPGSPECPMAGRFIIRGEDGGFALVPEDDPRSPGWFFEDGSPIIDLEENHWNPKTLLGGEGVRWPMSKEIHLILLPDVGRGWKILGFGGVNRFQGSVEYDSERFVVDSVSGTRMTGPGIEFENLYVRRISETTRYVQAGVDLYFFAETLPVAAFRMRFYD